MPTKPFYNTIQLNEDELKVESVKALSLQSIILNTFECEHDKEISPWQMKHKLEMSLHKKVNINSVRRSMTNLKNERILIKTSNMRMGDEGKNEHYYLLKPQKKNIDISKNGFQNTLF